LEIVRYLREYVAEKSMFGAGADGAVFRDTVYNSTQKHKHC